MARPREQPFEVGPAQSGERAEAFRLLFRYADEAGNDRRVATGLAMLRKGELEAEGLVVARGADGLVGAMLCLPVPGASGLVWPPQSVAGARGREVEDALVRHASDWLRGRGAKLAQALLSVRDAAYAGPLERNGFAHVTNLWYLRHPMELSAAQLTAAEQLTYRTYADGDAEVFHQTLVRTYEGTQDCPEINGVRTVEEVIAGHRAQGKHDPGHWWLALYRGRPVGVLLVTDVPEFGAWDVAYVGIVPEARRRGLGRELMVKALVEARAEDVRQLTLSVDGRNRPAWDLYRSLGFEAYDQREVYLAIWR